MSAEGDGAMQLAAQRIALNLREAGFNVQMANGRLSACRSCTEEVSDCGDDPAAALERILWDAGEACAGDANRRRQISIKRRTDRFWKCTKIVPLLDLPLGYANGARVSDLRSAG